MPLPFRPFTLAAIVCLVGCGSARVYVYDQDQNELSVRCGDGRTTVDGATFDFEPSRLRYARTRDGALTGVATSYVWDGSERFQTFDTFGNISASGPGFPLAAGGELYVLTDSVARRIQDHVGQPYQFVADGDSIVVGQQRLAVVSPFEGCE